MRTSPSVAPHAASRRSSLATRATNRSACATSDSSASATLIVARSMRCAISASAARSRGRATLGSGRRLMAAEGAREHHRAVSALLAREVDRGDLSRKITVDVKGEILELKNTVNTMVDQLSSFAAEVTRVAREVGTEGKLGGQANVRGVAGTWKDLTDTVNLMAVEPDRAAARHVEGRDRDRQRRPDAEDHRRRARRNPPDQERRSTRWWTSSRSFASEVTRVAREVGTEGELGGQADVKGVAGTWKDLTDSVNSMAGNLTAQVRNIAAVTTAVANGDLSKKITVPVKGEILELKNTINTMVDQLNVLRVRSDARGARGGHRRKARRPGRSATASPARGRT